MPAVAPEPVKELRTELFALALKAAEPFRFSSQSEEQVRESIDVAVRRMIEERRVDERDVLVAKTNLELLIVAAKALEVKTQPQIGPGSELTDLTITGTLSGLAPIQMLGWPFDRYP